jgi:outer membrane receptor for ferrienterochelin and colicin
MCPRGGAHRRAGVVRTVEAIASSGRGPRTSFAPERNPRGGSSAQSELRAGSALAHSIANPRLIWTGELMELSAMKSLSHLALALLCVSAGGALAQETTTGSVSGTVVDVTGAVLPGVTVTLTSDQGSKSFVTDRQGRFFAPYLTPGRYDLSLDLEGFAPVVRKDVAVRLGQQIELEFTMRVGGVEETVQVVAASPTVDTSSASAGGVLDNETIQHLPVGRRFSDSLYLVPGVTSSGVGAANPAVAGASGLENNYIVDGVNITNTGYGALGSYSIFFGSLGNGVTQDFIKETQVKTAGLEAEYGQATGGVVNVVTKSGSNDFHGSAYGFFRPDALESDFRQLQTVNGTVNDRGSDNIDFGVTLGGPLIKDKLFAFGAFNPTYQTRRLIAPEGFPLESLGVVEQKRTIYSYAAKLTFQASSMHRFDASFYGDPAQGEMGPQRLGSLIRSDLTGFSELKKYGGHQQVLRYDGIVSSNWLVEASVAHSRNTLEEIPQIDEWLVTDRTVTPNVVSGGIGFYEQGNDSENTQYAVKSTNFFDAAGRHRVRYGGSFEDIKYANVNQRTGPTFTLPNGTQTATGAQIQILADPVYGRIYRVTRANLNTERNTTQHYLNFFVQDTWEIGDRLTVKPGLRYEQQKIVGMLDEIKLDNNWAPRIGIVFDPKGDGKSKLYANWGRFYAQIPNDLAARALSADDSVSRVDYFDGNLTRPVPEGTLAANTTVHFLRAGQFPDFVDPNVKATYTNELLAGYEMELGHGFNVGLRYVYRNLPRTLEDVGVDADGNAVTLYQYVNDPDVAANLNYLLTNPAPGQPVVGVPGVSYESPIHTYHAVEVTANKAFSHDWALNASYRWSRLRGTFEGFYRNDNGQSDPGITSLFDFPTNDPTYTELGAEQGFRGDIRYLGALGQGPLPNDREHQFKLYGARSFKDLNLGLGFFASSGQPLTALAAMPGYENGGEIPEGPRGSGIETVDGFKTRTPWEWTVDLHADYAIKVNKNRQRLVLIADVFNVTNRQEPTNYDNFTETTFGAINPNFGEPTNGGGVLSTSYQTPRRIRLGARFEW